MNSNSTCGNCGWRPRWQRGDAAVCPAAGDGESGGRLLVRRDMPGCDAWISMTSADAASFAFKALSAPVAAR